MSLSVTVAEGPKASDNFHPAIQSVAYPADLDSPRLQNIDRMVLVQLDDGHL